ncbi:hypothetical protein HT136_00120 [Novosphingobium profundi]|uniref:hypothetical protein n=1 Tax=Novosphingobium profundi TaxID=1774954 RepID=UPI001BD969F9|nr:hypothetical protein [Novosphingobium profundi]MBT0666774.1 hypothetical protein [Novosphingobium profundi]
MARSSPPDTPATGSILARFEATLAGHDSATLALERWWSRRGLAAPVRIQVRVIERALALPPPDILRALALARGEEAARRRVELRCGPHVLSIATNWYAPARLPADMNRALAQGEEPFGTVVAPLGFRRRRLERHFPPSTACPAGTVSAHRALLVLPDGRPLAHVHECYTQANLAPPPG